MIHHESATRSSAYATSHFVGSKDRTNPRHKNVILFAFRVCLVISAATILCHQSVVYNDNDNDDADLTHQNVMLFLRKNETPPTETNTNKFASTHDNIMGFLHKKATSPTESMANKFASTHDNIMNFLHKNVTPPTDTTALNKLFTPCPKELCKLVWFKGGSSHKLYESVYRAFHSRGYSATKNVTRAHFLWSDQPNDPGDFYETLKPWQRYNQLPNTDKWDDKDEMAMRMNSYYSERGIPHLHSFPESYVLHRRNELEAFRERLLKENGGIDVPWVLKEPTVNQGKGIVILPPQSEELEAIVDIVKLKILKEKKEDKEKTSEGDRLVVQRYICDEMTYAGRKFDVRVFWAVASVDPLIVLYHTEQNYVRIGHAKYDESKLATSSTKAHLTTHTFGSTETKATWDEFREFIENHVFGNDSNHWERFSRNNIDKSKSESGILKTIETINNDPFEHVQNQMKTVIGHLADAYQNITFNGRSMVAENGFTWHAADMIIDNNLDVYIIEGTDGPGKDEDYDFRIRMHDELLGSLVDIVEEVARRQEEGQPLDISTMKEMGVMGGYEVVYNNGWYMDYRYERLPQKECNGGKGGSSKQAVSTRKIVPATFTALTKKNENEIAKTFWMKSRTKRTSEPVARSLRRNGWIPVDKPEDAQLVYETEGKFEQYKDSSRLWQWVSQFPSQYSFFEGDHVKYLDYSSKSGRVCRPIRHKGRALEVMVYWLVLSLDPLIVLFHDGFLYFPYSEKDENEFIELSKRGGAKDRVWKGSWKAFEHYLNVTHDNVVHFGKSTAAIAASSIALDPMSHVRNQMKASIVKIARGFQKHTAKLEVEQETYSSFAIFYAQFQIDRNLNVFAMDTFHSYIKGEDHAEVISLHDDLYGSAFRLLEYLNSTSSVKLPYEKDNESEEILGNFEWLIRPQAPKTKPWKFKYDWDYKANECFESKE